MFLDSNNMHSLFKLKGIFFLIFSVSCFFQGCKQKPETTDKGVSIISLDSTAVPPFFSNHPELKIYSDDYREIYDRYDYHYIWFNENGMVDFAKSLYNRANLLKEEGIYAEFPYHDKIDEISNSKIENPEEHPEAELLMTGLYLFYIDHVYQGTGIKKTEDLGWLLPRKDLDETETLDSIIAENSLDKEGSLMFSQYYKLRKTLQIYREIEKEGGWSDIEIDKNEKFKPGDTSEVIRKIRERLYISHEIKNNNESNIYDDELKKGIISFQKRHGLNRDSIISIEHIEALNIPINEYIKKIVVNMERSRWLPPGLINADEMILVNVPAFHLELYEDGEVTFESDVIVGSQFHATVIFDGEMSYLAFSPYWNIPQSIINNEIKPGMDREGDAYLKNRNMEWNDGQVRQLPGKNNSLGLVKFMFPNENNIYLHDTPAKSLFKNEDRARSHGCIRVAKARDLAIKILENDEKWTAEKIDNAMNAGKESVYTLKNKIPVYIGYFTAWVNEDGTIHFYKDVYNHDDKIADLLFYKP